MFIIFSFIQVFCGGCSSLFDYSLFKNQNGQENLILLLETDGFGFLKYEIKKRSSLFVQIKRAMLNVFKCLLINQMYVLMVINSKQITGAPLSIKYTHTRNGSLASPPLVVNFK